jgi:hypothetical protein
LTHAGVWPNYELINWLSPFVTVAQTYTVHASYRGSPLFAGDVHSSSQSGQQHLFRGSVVLQTYLQNYTASHPYLLHILHFKLMKIRICTPVALYGCETWSFTL